MDAVIRYLRNHPAAMRVMSVVTVLLLVGAAGLIGYPVYTNFKHDRLQHRLSDELASGQLQQAYRDGSLEIGDALTRIKIPKLGVDTVVVQGTTPSALRAGAGHYPNTPLPCASGNVAIAGHRTTFGRPFRDIDRLNPGDEIILETPIGSCTYKVEKAPTPFKVAPGMAAAFSVKPNNLSVIDQDPGLSELTLTTCHPKGSASERLVIRAVRVTSEAGSG